MSDWLEYGGIADFHFISKIMANVDGIRFLFQHIFLNRNFYSDCILKFMKIIRIISFEATTSLNVMHLGMRIAME